MKTKSILLLMLPLVLMFGACGNRGEEITLEEAAELKDSTRNELLMKTVTKPGGGPYPSGHIGGTWVATLNNDPQTFNTLTARDGDSRAVIDGVLNDYLADYDPNEREFVPNLADFEVEIDEAEDTMRIIYTLRDDLYWTTPDSDPSSWVRVTSDDVVFWYDEIVGDRTLQQPEYPGQFVKMPDGEERRIEIEKIDDRRFAFEYPRIVANPILSTNMTFGPKYFYEPAKREGGVDALLALFSVDTDPRTIPSIGQYHIIEYTPGVRVVLRRNPNYWKKDENGTSYPYIEEIIYRIVPDVNTEFLLFKEGRKDNYVVRPEDLEELVSAPNPDYTVYNGGEALGAGFFTFNQNPANPNRNVYRWFSQTKFRQAMASMLNRERIIEQVFRGLAEPADYFFAKANPMFDESIKQNFTYDPERAKELLAEIGIEPNARGMMEDAEGVPVEFEINVGTESNTGIDMASIYADELQAIGINAKVRPVDFQKLVEMLTKTYDWHVSMLGAWVNYWPSSGSNVWQSSGNFHLWYPLQAQPATEWEARIDYLYNAGQFEPDEEKRKEIYDEYQRILLDQVPVLYIAYPLSFLAVRDRWDNVFFDTLNGFDTTYVFLKTP